MTYKKINNIVGWAVFGVALIVYLLTMEQHGSLWDCGEFAGSAARLGVPHPPGAPLFTLIGRIFALFGKAIGKGEGWGVAFSSVVSSAFTILFLFWTITHFAKKIKSNLAINTGGLKGDALQLGGNTILSQSAIFDVMAAGVIGALAYTFSDSFWYSAVESEVYAMSSFCTAIVFWAALKWEDHPLNTLEAGINGRNQADKWMILIFFIMGMSIGVHLLNILTIPPIILIYYFKRYKQSTKGTLIALLVSIIVLGFVQKVVGQWSIVASFPFEKMFVNDFGLPVTSGFFFFFILLGIGVYFLLKYFNKKNWGTLRLATWCLSFTLIGMSTYITTMIRAKANPGIDMYNVDNPYALKGYLGREQYGDFPLLYGQTYEARQVDQEQGDDKYVLHKDEAGKLKYENVGSDVKLTYASEDMMLFPRIWYGNEENRKQFYKSWLNPKSDLVEIEYQPDNGQYKQVGQTVTQTFTTEQEANDEAKKANERADSKNKAAQQTGSSVFQYDVKDHLTQKENINWLFTYQINWMYLRYFMWNFAGKQNDIQGFGSTRDGNWISGIGFIDNIRLGNQAALPTKLQNNKANNKLYFLPFILGILGFVYQYRKNKNDTLVNTLLFVMTGLAIVGYLNQYGLQPRERDYAFVGSFYAFAIFMGLGVLQVRDWFGKLTKGITAGALAAAVCFVAVPALMCSVEWDDHDRNKKTLAKDLAIDYLESCPKNAILFTIGDNDTYPLWYAQEVEGIRKDIRVVNTSLLGIDWYLDQLKYKVNESAPFKMVWDSKDYEGPKMEYAFQKNYMGINENTTLPIDSFLQIATKQTEDSRYGNKRYYYPTKSYSINVLPSAANVLNLQLGDTLASRVVCNISNGKDALTKGDFGVMNILAGNINDRPICFTDDNGADLDAMGIQPYLRRQGMVYQFIPSTSFKKVETSLYPDIMLKNFAFANAKTKGVYYDEENRRHLESIRDTYIRTAQQLVQDGDMEKAKAILAKINTEIPEFNLPYATPSRGEFTNASSLNMARAAYMAGDVALGKKIYDQVSADVQEQLKYFYKMSNPSGNATTENIAAMVTEFESMMAIENKSRSQGITKEENDQHDAINKKIFKKDLTGMVLQDFYGNMRNYNTIKQLKVQFDATAAAALPTKQ